MSGLRTHITEEILAAYEATYDETGACAPLDEIAEMAGVSRRCAARHRDQLMAQGWLARPWGGRSALVPQRKSR